MLTVHQALHWALIWTLSFELEVVCYWHHFTVEENALDNLPKATELIHAEQGLKSSDLTPNPALYPLF